MYIYFEDPVHLSSFYPDPLSTFCCLQGEVQGKLLSSTRLQLEIPTLFSSLPSPRFSDSPELPATAAECHTVFAVGKLHHYLSASKYVSPSPSFHCLVFFWEQTLPVDYKTLHLWLRTVALLVLGHSAHQQLTP